MNREMVDMMNAGQHASHFANSRAKEHDKRDNRSPGFKNMLRAKEAKLVAEHRWEMNRDNACTQCWMIKNKNGYCPMGCNA